METLYLFSSTRAMKQFFAQHYANDFLPSAKGIGEFLDFILRVENKRKIPSFLREFYLYRAICVSDTQKLGEFAKNFTQFLQNSSFFLKFYDELCAECVQIDALEKLDIYAFYDDHLQVLKAVFAEYQKLLLQAQFFDQYFLENYQITRELLQEFERIIVQVDGFLSCFEMQVFKQISAWIPLVFELHLDDFNQEYYSNLFQLDLAYGFHKIVLENQNFSILESQNESVKACNLQLLEFQDRIAEVGGIFAQIDIWLQKGVQPEQIHIVLPDESFMEYLKLFDKARNFNYAMGIPLQNARFFKTIELLLESSACAFSDFSAFVEYCNGLLENENLRVKEKILEALDEFQFSLPYLKSLQVNEQILAFLNLLKSKSVDDVGGGRISVIGILETRGVCLEYVIIPEFNAQNVPSISDKDIFLNTSIREKVGLPTRKNRENLQKHYYNQLLARAKEACILCLHNEESKPSRFLLEDSIFGGVSLQKTSLEYSAYFIKGDALHYKTREIIAPLEATSFSATSLQCFLTCKRKYYYRYILKLKSQETEAVNIGSKIHNALKEVYENMSLTDRNVDSLYLALCEKLNISASARERFDSELAKKYLKRVFSYEKEHLKQGWIPVALEQEFCIECADFMLNGRVDRVDRMGERVLVLDYKYKRNLEVDKQKNYEKAVDFQLPIYFLAMQKQYPNCQIDAGFYDLYDATIKKESDLEQKVSILQEKLQEIKKSAKEVDYSLREKRDMCQYCDFIYLCNRY